MNTGYDMQQVLAIDLPMQTLGASTDQDLAFYQQVTQKIAALPGVEGVSMGSFTPWRDAGKLGSARAFRSARTASRPRTAKRIRARGFASSRRTSSTSWACRSLAGRDFTPEDRRGTQNR